MEVRLVKIPFNKPPVTGNEIEYLKDLFQNQRVFSGNGPYTQRCERWFEEQLGVHRALLVPSCTAALEMAALLLEIGPGDEVIVPNYTFVSTANAFALRGATIVFVDIRPDTLNLDEKLIEAAITPRTRAIVPVHYAGVSCNMQEINDIARKHGLYVVEDAAQGVAATYQGRPLGTLGTLGAFSFHESKNYSCGEGGLLLINDTRLASRAEIIREKGTNRSEFFRGQVDKYRWMDIGSSFLMSEMQAVCLWAQLEHMQEILACRLKTWNRYFQLLSPLQASGQIELPTVPPDCSHNGHLFYIKVATPEIRDFLLIHLNKKEIHVTFHYLALHSSPAGRNLGRLAGKDRYTSSESARLLRLPLYYGMTEKEQDIVVEELCHLLIAFSGNKGGSE